MSRNTAKPWFAAKRYGYGSGLPIAWQGWVLFIAYIVVCIGAPVILTFVLHEQQALDQASLATIGAATVILMIVVARRTKGGWRWRWGKDD